MKFFRRVAPAFFAVAVAFSLTAPAGAATNTAPTAPLRPTFRDVSLKAITGPNNQNPYAFYRGHSTTQTEQDALESTLIGKALPAVWRFARDIPACAAVRHYVIDKISSVTAKLGAMAYEGRSLIPHGTWQENTYGRHYAVERYSLLAIQGCVTSSKGAPQCGQSVPADVADLLDIRVEAGRCVHGALFDLVPHDGPYDNARGDIAIINNKIRQPALTDHQVQLVEATHTAHHAVTESRCGGDATNADVNGAHLALEASARTEIEHHFLRMKDFAGNPDPRWSADEVCLWSRFQDDAHARWMDAVEHGNWGAARMADDDHEGAHIALQVDDFELRFQWDCGDPYPAGCPKLTEAETLTMLRSRYGR